MPGRHQSPSPSTAAFACCSAWPTRYAPAARRIRQAPRARTGHGAGHRRHAGSRRRRRGPAGPHTRRIIRQNLGWAFGYNLLLVALAASGILPPVLAAVAIATSSVTVVGNALRLLRFATTGQCPAVPFRLRLRLPDYHGDVAAEVRLLKLTEEAGEAAEALRSRSRRVLLLWPGDDQGPVGDQ